MATRRPNANTSGRVPPHNIEAEQSLLGAALLSRHGVEALVDITAARDFYRPAHQHIADAVIALAAADAPVDTTTVAEALRQSGLLDEVGGREELRALQNATPAVTAARYYAKIVHDTATLRRVLFSASDIADIAYAEPDPAQALLDVARVVDALGTIDVEDISTLEVADVAALIAGGLDLEEADFLTRSDGGALLYAGKMHVLQAEPTTGKSWIALQAVDEVLRMGGACIYIDFEDTARGIIGRLMALGAAPEVLGARFRYVQPIGAYGPAERARLTALMADLNPDLVIIDGVGEALARDGLSEDKAPDVMAWIDRLPRPIARTGAAVLMIDHVVKDREQQGRWARGSGAKLGAVDGATYQLKVVTPFSRHRAGKIKVIVAKDRPGGVGALGETVAVVTITPYADGARVVITVDANTEELASSDTFKPTHLMERISSLLEEATVPLTPSGLKAMLPRSKPTLIYGAIARLVAEGFVTEGKGRSRTLTSIRRYLAPADDRHLRAVPNEPDEHPPPEQPRLPGDDLDPYQD